MSTSTNKGFETINPTTEQTIQHYDYMTVDQALKAVDECQDAFLDWKLKPLEDRAKIIKAVGKTLVEEKDSYAKLMTQEMGKLVAHSYDEIELCAGICEYTATEGVKKLQDEVRTMENGGKGIIQQAPLGVIYGIQPWNFPLYQAIRYTIVNLMAGNGVLLKHAKNVTGSALKLKEVLEKAGLPKNLFTVLIIDHETSDKIIEHKAVRGVTLTGSSKAGEYVAQKAAKVLKKTVLELGSNDAYLVLDDADVDLAVQTSIVGRTYNNGETCVAAKRFIVVDKVYDQFKAAFVKGMEAVTYGDPMDKDSKLGPMARKDLRDKIHQQVEDSVSNGATILCGGKIPDVTGYFYPSTVLGDVKPGQPAYSEELFGPVASLIKAKDNQDAMRIANDSRFGLGGGIFSKDEEKAIQLAKDHFDTGMININSYGLAHPNMPFGGIKDSGYGREHGGFGITEFVNTKAIMLNNSK
ncbi:NAD-dependent succinate-semialdehyde dehydrogenase [Psychroserpens sp. NJDZ02]|uniref:NAD-dependent succinate-semialdehyde dehydrogenase n=1 Tax=Psychroserpens sp. NJDZ02 TaxID=2570561 RepID=UPI0010A89354|nr:NAD-dependent succinate-semialdehyde dehydrogenase [Psychroserpens sp. NJDZ02]QCE42872.1 NAD-dependent succinate-semialdehyde dehydrogenase [Psychroserpens sp. NJDZ02]